MTPQLAPRIAIALAAAALAAFALSCARDLPTSPGAHSTFATSKHRMEDRDFENEVAVTLVPGADAAAVADSYGATLLAWDINAHVAAFRPGDSDDAHSLTARLACDPRVTTSELNSDVQPAESRQKSFAFDDGRNTPENTGAQPAFAAVHSPQGIAVSRGDGVRIAVLDTGIDSNHPQFAGRVVSQWDFIEDHPGAEEVPSGVDSNDDGVPDGAFGHGTHVAGIITLVAPGAQLIVGRVLDSDGVGDVLTVAAGIQWARQQGANVINLSLGTLAPSCAISEAIEDAEEHGIIVVASAGNWGAPEPQEYPARSSHVLAIAACDVDARPMQWSSYAPFVALSAPGEGIRSAYPGGGFRQWSGTSMSTAFVSGAAALLRAEHRTWDRRDVRDRLAEYAATMTNVAPERVGLVGAGMLDIGAALAPDAPQGDEGAIITPGKH